MSPTHRKIHQNFPKEGAFPKSSETDPHSGGCTVASASIQPKPCEVLQQRELTQPYSQAIYSSLFLLCKAPGHHPTEQALTAGLGLRGQRLTWGPQQALATLMETPR